MEKLRFYSKLPISYLILWGVLGAIFTLCTLMLLWDNTYEFFFERQGYLNRKILLKYISRKEFILPSNSKLLIDSSIEEYIIDNYELWVYNKQSNITLSSNTDINIIGLFQSGKYTKRTVNQIIERINQLKTY